ncbi:DHH family phosphoesterase [Clostridium sp. YIM B02551]|uniref:DHH family phosphoesterase n=1 Tax=Clostridium sp. YIM B02551 TaxID=2910679 RepID=UPI001EEB3B41|nr:DHH family phosphoesterase [Clostridium sp. YIM B02551]
MNNKSKNYNIVFTLVIILISIVAYVRNIIDLLLGITIMALIVAAYNFRKRLQTQERFENNVNNMATYLSNEMEENLKNMLYSIAIINNKGSILWSNKKFKDEIDLEELKDNNIVGLFRDLSLEKIIKSNIKNSQKVKFRDIIYEVYSQKIEFFQKQEAYLLYFNDITYLENGSATKDSIMLIEVDNMSDAAKSMEENNAPLLIAEVERTINNYAISQNAMIRKYDSNKYVLCIPDRLVEEQIKKKFDILDIIRDIDMGNKMDVTLSIGIGMGGRSPQENHDYAVTAKELALGRGGDQAVVKWPDKQAFFGGNTKELEKRTRVRARVVARALKDLVYESSKVYIMGHKNPDMDCFGAAFGLSSAINQIGKQCKIILGKDNRNIDFYLKEVKKDSSYDDLFINVEDALNEIKETDLVIVVDVHNINYIQTSSILNKCKRIVIIDHHRRSPDMIEGALLNYIEVYASSTSELVTEVVQYMLDKPKLKVIEAEALLAGIFIDTKNFIFKTGVRTFDAASFLRRIGADTIHIKKLFSDDLESYIIKAQTIKSAEVENNVAIAICPPEATEVVLAAQVADDLLNITGIQASFVFVRIEEDIYISARSLGDMNVQVILETLGGGGHMTMAGAKLSNTNIKAAKEKLKAAISNYLREGE